MKNKYLLVLIICILTMIGCGNDKESNSYERDRNREDDREERSIDNEAEEDKVEEIIEEQVLVDYGNDIAFENALNSGENVIGKIVTFNVNEVHPDSYFGHNLWAGVHLNFVSDSDPGKKMGEDVTVKVNKVESISVSWIVYYELVENAVVGDNTIFEYEVIGYSEESENEVSIVKEYDYDMYGVYTMHFIVLENNGNSPVDVSASSLAYDADGNVMGASDGYVNAVGPGCTTVLLEGFDVEGKIDSYETEFSYKESMYKESGVENLVITSDPVSSGVVVYIENTGDKPVEFVEAYVLFFNNGELIEYDSTYFTDDEYELKPGKKIFNQLDSYEDYDSYEIYVHGRVSNY